MCFKCLINDVALNMPFPLAQTASSCNEESAENGITDKVRSK